MCVLQECSAAALQGLLGASGAALHECSSPALQQLLQSCSAGMLSSSSAGALEVLCMSARHLLHQQLCKGAPPLLWMASGAALDV